jgi:hypothetical protein
VRGRGHRYRTVDDGVCGPVEFGQCGGGDDGDRVTAVRPEFARCEGCFEAEFERVVAALSGCALVALVGRGAVGSVPAGPHRGFDGFEVRAGLGVEHPGQPRHAVGPLRAQMQPAATRPVVVVEEAVGVEVVGDPLAQLDDDARIEFARMPDQGALGFSHVGGRHARGQDVEGSAYGADVVLADRAGCHRGRQPGQLRRHRRTSQRAPRPDTGRQLEPADDLFGGDAQQRAQPCSHRRDGLAAVGRFGDLSEEPIHQPAVGAVLRLQPLGDVHAEIVANHVGAGVAQHGVPSIDGVESGTDPLPRLFGTRARTHAPTL